jgi:Arc/MetJ-type ribon-helix-helix transcriptional regulator
VGKTNVTLYIDNADLAFVEDVAALEGSSVSAVIRSALREWIRKQKKEAEKP